MITELAILPSASRQSDWIGTLLDWEWRTLSDLSPEPFELFDAMANSIAIGFASLYSDICSQYNYIFHNFRLWLVLDLPCREWCRCALRLIFWGPHKISSFFGALFSPSFGGKNIKKSRPQVWERWGARLLEGAFSPLFSNAIFSSYFVIVGSSLGPPVVVGVCARSSTWRIRPALFLTF